MSQPPGIGPYGEPGPVGSGHAPGHAPGYGPGYPPGHAPGHAPGGGPTGPAGPKGSSTGLIVAMVAAVAVVVVGVIAAVVLLRGGDDPAPVATIDTQPEQPVAPAPAPAPAPVPAPAPAADAGDADLEVTLTWASTADLDLVVVTPAGQETPRGGPTGATVDQLANDGCTAPTATAHERARWDRGRAEPGSYLVRVVHRADCGTSGAAQPFEVRVLLPAVGVATFEDQLAPGGSIDLFSVRFPSGEVLDLRTNAAAPIAPTDAPFDVGNESAGDMAVTQLPGGLFCRDLYGAGYPYWDAVTYWEREGRPARMDATGDGFPCTTTYPWAAVRDYWGTMIDPTFQEGGDVSTDGWDGDSSASGWAGQPVTQLPGGLYCRDLYGAGYPYWDAVTYWELEGSPSRMDATGDGFPCTTTYPWAAVRDYWGTMIDPTFQEGGDVS